MEVAQLLDLVRVGALLVPARHLEIRGKVLEGWMREERMKLSRGNDVAKAMDYMLKRWPSFTRFLEDGRICLSNNAAERALRGIALGRKSWLFAGHSAYHTSQLSHPGKF